MQRDNVRFLPRTATYRVRVVLAATNMQTQAFEMVLTGVYHDVTNIWAATNEGN